MLHLDEGTLHALLDGELSLSEASEVQGHIGTCTACGARLQEMKQFLAEADRLVGALELPARSTERARPPQAGLAEEKRRPQPLPPDPPAYREPDPWASPVILLPEPSEGAGRKPWITALRWAAMIALVLGGGRLILSMVRPNSSIPTERDITLAAPPRAPAVISPEETRSANPEPALSRAVPSRSDSKTANVQAPIQRKVPAPKPAPPPAAAADEATTDSSAELADSSAFASSDTAADSVAALAAAAVPESAATVGESAAAAPAPTTTRAAKDIQRQGDEAATRRAAAEALAELDAQRRRERAAAATAALSQARTESTPPAETPPPVPRTPEQRAQIYLRIGLDEANRQLGRPLHVIEGMTPTVVGLVQARLVPGADPTRPVVRVVYLDSRNRIILLDQQKLAAGQSPGASEGSLRWTIGDVMLYLRGEPSQDVLRSLQRRVR